ncbi:hypothetical protein HHK36_033252 [Tetracentron sinense]|uniref:Neprosin PEP catalytic domain-containing protein n=1 Tax=Tetracentron sinense TaxID=13715 RepID=A0A835CWU9_TETSI|nr:hypothetical protein HHK36_033252 [Tetracentron sinense]
MALRVSMKVLILLFFAISLSWSSHGVEGEPSISEEDAELERELKIINKPAIKVIKTDYGDIYDCVDINKQPAFDHPLLKNHKIQVYFVTRSVAVPVQEEQQGATIAADIVAPTQTVVAPTVAAPVSLRRSSRDRRSAMSSDYEVYLNEGLFDKASSSSSVEEPPNVKPSQIGLKNRCPPGSVPIRRTRKEDLIRVKKNPSQYQPLTDSAPGHHYVNNYVSTVPYHGGGAWIGVYNPAVSNGQFSNAVMSIDNGYGDNRNSIQVGWTVDGFQKTGCFDTRCAGFVQVSTEIALGLPFRNISIVDGPQYNTKVVIYQDLSTGNWWLSFREDNVHIGYWPQSLFTSLATSASYVKWGAEVYSQSGEVSPPMGSGQLPTEGANKACFFRGLQVIYDTNLADPREDFLTRRKIDNPDCYNADEVKKFKVLDYYFFFGGPGGTNCGN